MKLYDIDIEIRNLLSQANDDGEISDDVADRLTELAIAREAKIEGAACFVKELDAEAVAIRNEEKALADRRKALESKAEHITNWLDYVLGGEKFSTPRVALSYRSSKAVEVTDVTLLPADYVRTKIEPDKVALAADLKAGQAIPGAYLIERRRLQIK